MLLGKFPDTTETYKKYKKELNDLLQSRQKNVKKVYKSRQKNVEESDK